MTIGGDEFAKFGTQSSTGTKVFSLVGKIKNTGLVELPLGTPLENIIYQMVKEQEIRKRSAQFKPADHPADVFR